MEIFFDVKKCAHCGRDFVPAPYHTYKCDVNHQTKWLCGYKCYDTYLTKQESKGNRRKNYLRNIKRDT